MLRVLVAERRRVYLTSATGALSTESAPVGGGVAVLEALGPRLAAREDLEVTLLTPAHSESEACSNGLRRISLPVPTLAAGRPERLLSLGERAYARFALEWERALGDFFSGVDPNGATVVANDVSEGPPFAELAARGFEQLVLYHVVVAEFFSRRYLHGPWGMRVPEAWAARAWQGVEGLGLQRLAPRIARLVWAKEKQAAESAKALVPSEDLGSALARCYPRSGVEQRTHVIPWGVIGQPDPERRDRRAKTLTTLGLEGDRFVLLTLSRISPEKRIELLLRSLERLERQRPDLARRIALIVAGGPAYMGGERYLERLEQRAARLRSIPVHFAGYLSGDAKWDLFAAADLFCSPSAYEAYGLTIAQALASGTPVLAADHQGARAIVSERTGWVVRSSAREMSAALERIVATDLSPLRAAARSWGEQHPFELASREVSALLEAPGRPAALSG